jgi:hypothetical protein
VGVARIDPLANELKVLEVHEAEERPLYATIRPL